MMKKLLLTINKLVLKVRKLNEINQVNLDNFIILAENKTNKNYRKSILIQSKWFVDAKDYKSIDGVYTLQFQQFQQEAVQVESFLCDEHMHCESIKQTQTPQEKDKKLIKVKLSYHKSTSLTGLLKFVFKVTYDQSLDTKFLKFSIGEFNFGDLCFPEDQHPLGSCKNGRCNPKAFLDYECDCKDQKRELYFGKYCEQPNYCLNDISDVSYILQNFFYKSCQFSFLVYQIYQRVKLVKNFVPITRPHAIHLWKPI